MAIQFSTGLRNFIQNFGSYKRAVQGGKMVIYQGTVPTDPDAAISGTALVTCTDTSQAHTQETRSRGSVTITVDGTVTGITVNSIQIMSGTVSATGDTTNTAAAVAANINAHIASVQYKAWNSANKVIIEAMPGTGTAPNGFTVTSAGGATRTDVNMGTERAGVASANGLLYGVASDGVVSKSGTWSGTIGTSGTANYFVIYGPNSDDSAGADASPYHFYRIIGTCGTSGADYIMASTTLTSTQTHTVDTGTITLNEEV